MTNKIALEVGKTYSTIGKSDMKITIKHIISEDNLAIGYSRSGNVPWCYNATTGELIDGHKQPNYQNKFDLVIKPKLKVGKYYSVCRTVTIVIGVISGDDENSGFGYIFGDNLLQSAEYCFNDYIFGFGAYKIEIDTSTFEEILPEKK